MKPEDVRRLYDETYASSYEQKFLTGAMSNADTLYEEELLQSLMPEEGEWLDVACGTGYFLSRFPNIKRSGLDLSPDMLHRARVANPGVELREHDFRLTLPDWDHRFDLVSCMWYAYSYVDTIDDILTWIRNLASWTSATGKCFVPIGDPQLIARCQLPYRIDHGWPGGLVVTAILWSYVEDGGAKAHKHLVAPHVAFLKEEFERFFHVVDIVRYPGSERPALIASGKRPPCG